MLGLFGEPSRRRFLLNTALPILLLGTALNSMCAIFLYWSTEQADRASTERQRDLAELVTSKLMSSVAHEQESVTVWDDAVQAVNNPDTSGDWIDSNLGSWMNTYFGHDSAFVLAPDSSSIYASINGQIAPPEAFAEVAQASAPLVRDLRKRLAVGDQTGVSRRVLTPGATDIAKVRGRPAAISVKPIVSDTGEINIPPGREHLHIAVRYLDEALVRELRDDYLLTGLRFSWTNNIAAGEAAIPLTSVDGQSMGYFVWAPYRPGAAVRANTLPLLIVLGALSMGALALLLVGLRRRSLNLRQSQEAMRHLAAHDLLTGLPNRGQFDRRLDEAVSSVKTSGERVALLFLDLDRFKQVNDTLGHPAGDDLLREFAQRLRSFAKLSDTVARLSGDEFIMILRHVASQDEVEQLCRRIIESARHPFNVGGTQVFVGVSVGVAMIPRDGTDRVEITRRADVALYRAKAAGRSEFAIFVEEMDILINQRRDLEKDFRVALEDSHQLQVYYQPLIVAKSGERSGVEALLRWRHPRRGMVPPEIFIPLAEEAGLISLVGEFVLREALQTAKSLPTETVAVNVSALELKDSAYAVRVAAILMEIGIDAHRLELEVTETALGDAQGACAHNVAALRQLGVRVALDDFGTGFSSLARLQQLDVDRIKIDRSFIQGFGTDNGDEAIVRAIVELARATGLRTTAEGVETAEQVNTLEAMGCDELQGFLFSEPIPKDALLKLNAGGISPLRNPRAASAKR